MTARDKEIFYAATIKDKEVYPLLIVHISFRKYITSEEIFRFSVKAKTLDEAIRNLYEKHPEASCVGYKTIPIFE